MGSCLRRIVSHIVTRGVFLWNGVMLLQDIHPC